MFNDNDFFIGVDVGSGSARAVLVNQTGHIIASTTRDIRTWRNINDESMFEQSTTDIWEQVSKCVKDVLDQTHTSPQNVKGLGFTATCSLAVVNHEGIPISVNSDEGVGYPGERNVILWADHRAWKEADIINAARSNVLDYVGGAISLEMEIPKIMWLKNHMSRETFQNCQFFDLPDYLTYKATGFNTRSNCSLVCKTSFIPSDSVLPSFDSAFLGGIGLEDLATRPYPIIGDTQPREDGRIFALTAGLPVGQGLSSKGASDLGLVEGTACGSAVIDAYAGWIGSVASLPKTGIDTRTPPSVEASCRRLAVVAGTSTCHLIQSPDPIFVQGIWGPYKNAVLPGWWMNEGGQSTTGQLIEFVITSHPATTEMERLAAERHVHVIDVLDQELERLRVAASHDDFDESLLGLTIGLHMYPDVRGNRSPLADVKMRGSLVGFGMEKSLSDLALKYQITLEAIALQTRHIVEEMLLKGHRIEGIYMSGSQARNTTLMQLISDVCSVPVIIPDSPSTTVVTGAAMLGRMAAEMTQECQAWNEPLGSLDDLERLPQDHCHRLWQIMTSMTPPARILAPSTSARDGRILEAKYNIFREAIVIQRKWREEMDIAGRL